MFIVVHPFWFVVRGFDSRQLLCTVIGVVQKSPSDAVFVAW
jgi:hypothetical protein